MKSDQISSLLKLLFEILRSDEMNRVIAINLLLLISDKYCDFIHDKDIDELLDIIKKAINNHKELFSTLHYYKLLSTLINKELIKTLKLIHPDSTKILLSICKSSTLSVYINIF